MDPFSVFFCDECHTSTTRPSWLPIGGNRWRPACPSCADRIMQDLDRRAAVSIARCVVLDTLDLLNLGRPLPFDMDGVEEVAR